MKILPRLNRFFPAAFAAFFLCFNPASAKEKALDEYRALYQQAKNALSRNDQAKFNLAKRQLNDYALYPYLEYAELANNLSRASNGDVRNFLTTYKDVPVAGSLRHQWLNYLMKRDKWRDFVDFYSAQSASTRHQCYYQLARYRSGEKTAATNEAIKLWNVGKSQPKACDKLFAILTSKKLITEELAWQRYSKAVLARQYRLARYLQRFFTTPDYQQFAKNYYALGRNPRLVGNYSLFKKHPEDVLAVIARGIQQLARQDAMLAMQHWSHYQQTHHFDTAARSSIATSLVKGLYEQGFGDIADGYIDDNKNLIDSSLLEWRARKALAALDWPGLLQLIEKMPDELQQDNRWRYWHSRAEEVIATKLTPASRETYEQLALTRSHYGFLSSDRMGISYSMAHKRAITNGNALETMENDPHVIRTRELLHHGEFVHARREWRHATKGFTEQQWITAAHLTRDWEWHHGSINSMIKAAFWDDIDLRFPLAHRPVFTKHAEKTDVPTYLLMAVARQESAMAHDVTSPAGARGLMQLMPATARQTARKNGVNYKNSNDLFVPETNITLGSRYYKEMLERFNNNRILATAAYNAGPHRVDRWLKESGGKVPFDVWIEIIPFKETRGYVQNVLAFSMIYAHHLDIPTRMLKADEMERLL